MKVLVMLSFLVWSAVASAQSLYKEVAMPGGPFKGQILDTSKTRGVVFIDGENVVLPEVNPNYLYIANVTHNNKFYVARISPEAPKKVSFVYEKFTDMQGGHADLIYHLDSSDPMELVYEILDTQQGHRFVKLSKPIALNEILLTAEAVRVTGDKTPLKEGGLNDSFAMVYRMTSIPERLIGPVLETGRKTTVYDLNFDPQSVQKAFVETVIQQSYIGMSTNYHLLTNNCITSAVFGLINGLSKEEQARLRIQIAKTVAKLKTMSTKDLTEEEIQRMIKEYADILGEKGQNIVGQSIHKKVYFLKWLTKNQLKRSQQLLLEQES